MPKTDEDVGFPQFIAEMTSDIEQFKDWWMSEHKKNPDHFPIKMPLGEWDEQFRLWSSTQ